MHVHLNLKESHGACSGKAQVGGRHTETCLLPLHAVGAEKVTQRAASLEANLYSWSHYSVEVWDGQVEEKVKKNNLSIMKRDESGNGRLERNSFLQEASPTIWGHGEVPCTWESEPHPWTGQQVELTLEAEVPVSWLWEHESWPCLLPAFNKKLKKNPTWVMKIIFLE